MSRPDQDDQLHTAMRRAIGLAERGEGLVEPNPMVGCLVLREGEEVGHGWHERHGGPHAEVNALRRAGERARGATLVVTLEPCRHTGKTPPCTRAVLEAGVARVVVATLDPFPEVSGEGVAELRAAGVDCEVGVCEQEARRLIAPYLTLVEKERPWVLAKWAMTLDGKIATRTGESRWISSEGSRAVVHRLRGRVDAVAVGAGTLVADDPLLSARPAGPRVATRLVVAGDRPLPLDRQLWRSVDQGPVLAAVGQRYPEANAAELTALGVEVLRLGLPELLKELGGRRMTNLLVEGGAHLLGDLSDRGLVDEAHAFVAPKLLGGAAAPTPVAGGGIGSMAEALELQGVSVESIGPDVYLRGRRAESRK